MLSSQRVELPESLDGRVSRLMEYLRKARCLLVLDNAESILGSDNRAGSYRSSYEGYRYFFKCIAETRHQSCLVLTSRESYGKCLLRKVHPLSFAEVGGIGTGSWTKFDSGEKALLFQILSVKH
ncbi:MULTISPECIES: hypothetical protein [Leptolyngbya]|uniref:hypothetical protein n=1 Tax=Leptolyngbya TaxID=47251 RepID=UPI001687D9C0|nr:hypothetical protein [Leptolyngbya sp. FACHB-1624]MBD1856142.1 hypothetical protein [Leptolyngbya sp. FACHB-1624]